MVFVTVVPTVIVGVTLPGGSDTVTIVTGELSGGAACCERKSSYGHRSKQEEPSIHSKRGCVVLALF